MYDKAEFSPIVKRRKYETSEVSKVSKRDAAQSVNQKVEGDNALQCTCELA